MTVASEQVTVIGSVNRDTSVRVPRFPVPGETLEGSGASSGLGGKGANQAVAAARAGAPTTWIGAAGTDGNDVLDALAADGIDVSRSVRVSEAPTGTAWVMIEPSGENAIVIDPGANAHLRPDHVPERLDGLVLLQHEVPAAVIARAVEVARDAVTVVNPAPFRHLTPDVLGGVDVLVVNEIELAELTGAGGALTHLDDVSSALERLPQHTVIATLGARGAMVRHQEVVDRIEAPEVEAVDTTGAGDTFCGAFAAALARIDDIPAAVEFAVHAAALSVSRSGAQAAIPREAQVYSVMTALGGIDNGRTQPAAGSTPS